MVEDGLKSDQGAAQSEAAEEQIWDREDLAELCLKAFRACGQGPRGSAAFPMRLAWVLQSRLTFPFSGHVAQAEHVLSTLYSHYTLSL